MIVFFYHIKDISVLGILFNPKYIERLPDRCISEYIGTVHSLLDREEEGGWAGGI